MVHGTSTEMQHYMVVLAVREAAPTQYGLMPTNRMLNLRTQLMAQHSTH
jgi:hypothetical protein